jgi:hypothetical protein
MARGGPPGYSYSLKTNRMERDLLLGFSKYFGLIPYTTNKKFTRE